MPLHPAETFPALGALPFLRAAFLLRSPGIDVLADRETVLQRLWSAHHAAKDSLGFAGMPLATAGQVHGNRLAMVEPTTPFPVPEVDGLITTRPGLCLGIYVADCAAVYIADKHGRGIALAHSGKKGTELGITRNAISELCNATGAAPGDLVVQISPCIRPPHYEINFAADIARQARDAGVESVHDCGSCTASDPASYYSYRRELGRTGRMLALLALVGSNSQFSNRSGCQTPLVVIESQIR